MPVTDPGRPRILLVGLMGAGKSTVGRALADLLSCPYLDNDVLLEQQSRATAEQLATAPAGVLHAEESRQLDALLALPGPFVAGVAASVADRPDALTRLTRAGRVVYLRAAPATLAARVGAGADRPWLGDDPRRILERMFAARDDAFRATAHLTVDTDGRDPADIAAELAARLER
jgi:shikimate kinase